jgi:hypothetical protein
VTDEQLIRLFGDGRRKPRVRVKGGDYSYRGWLVTVFRKRRGALRCSVEDRNGRLFIHNARQVSSGKP